MRWLIALTAIVLLGACRITFIDHDDDDLNTPQFSSELFIRDAFNQSSDTFNLGEDILLEIAITNQTDETLVLEFDTERQYDFYITDSDLNPVWDWSASQTLGVADTEITFQPNQRITFTATWDQFNNDNQAVVAGEYLVQALIPVLGEGLNQHLSQQQSEFRTSIETITIQ